MIRIVMDRIAVIADVRYVHKKGKGEFITAGYYISHPSKVQPAVIICGARFGTERMKTTLRFFPGRKLHADSRQTQIKAAYQQIILG